jgi:hypothetical protein
MRHYPRKCLRRLPHHPHNVSGKRCIQHSRHQQPAYQPCLPQPTHPHGFDIVSDTCLQGSNLFRLPVDTPCDWFDPERGQDRCAFIGRAKRGNSRKSSFPRHINLSQKHRPRSIAAWPEPYPADNPATPCHPPPSDAPAHPWPPPAQSPVSLSRSPGSAPACRTPATGSPVSNRPH